MKKLNKILIGLGTATGLTAGAWGTWQYMKALSLQRNIDSIPWDVDKKHRRAKWFTKYRGQ